MSPRERGLPALWRPLSDTLALDTASQYVASLLRRDVVSPWPSSRRTRMLCFGFRLALLVSLIVPTSSALAQSACTFRGGFAQLQSLIPDQVGTCTANEQYRPDQGESTQTTSNGTLVWHSIDNAISFSDGFHAWVLDPNTQGQVRSIKEPFPFACHVDCLTPV